nr:hypothetical protein Itr_chr11CG12620 [Ipomoea trifida]
MHNTSLQEMSSGNFVEVIVEQDAASEENANICCYGIGNVITHSKSKPLPIPTKAPPQANQLPRVEGQDWSSEGEFEEEDKVDENGESSNEDDGEQGKAPSSHVTCTAAPTLEAFIHKENAKERSDDTMMDPPSHVSHPGLEWKRPKRRLT